MDSDVEHSGGGLEKKEKWVYDTSSSAGSDSSEESCPTCTQERRKRFFKRYYDGDRYDTESFDDEVPLKRPHAKKPPPPTYGFAPHFPWPGTDEEDQEEDKERKWMEFDRGEDYARAHVRSQLPLDSLFMDKWLEEYLGGPVKPWRRIRSSRDRVEIEPLDCDLLPPLKPYRPILVDIVSPSGKVTKVKRVCGYRELMEKRARVEQLCWIEAEVKLGQKLTCCPTNATFVNLRKKKKVKRRRSRAKVDLALKHQRKPLVTSDDVHGDRIAKVGTPVRLAEPPEARRHAQLNTDEAWTSRAGNDAESKLSSCGYSHFLENSLHFSNPFQLIPVGGADADEVSIASSVQDSDMDVSGGGDSESVAAQEAAEFSEAMPGEFDDTVSAIEDGDDSDSEEEEQSEKDNEWLQLSTSDSEELMFQYERIGKPKKKWMFDRLSYESQSFARALKGFMCLLSCCCRLPISRRVDKVVGLLLFSINRFRLLPFRITSCLLWVICVIIVDSTLVIMYGNDDDEFKALAEAELAKYKTAIMGIGVNLVFVSIWSMAIILRDGYDVCQFMNFLVASLTKFEISGTRRVRKTVAVNTLITLTYCGIMITAFYYDFPKTIRGSSGFLARLVARPFRHRIRTWHHGQLWLRKYYSPGFSTEFYFQVAGMCLHLFCYISLRFVFTLMHLLAVVLGNLAKNWNFRFGLCFAQFGCNQRAHLFRIHFGQSLIKLFTQHRLINGLIRDYGHVFAIPIITYYILQIALVSTVIIIMFFEGYSQTDILQHFDIPGTNKNISTNTPFENAATSGFFLAHFIFEFVLISEVISSACSPIMSSFEFVRRQGLMRCKNTHEVRLIMSLQWSMSAKNPPLVNVNDFFYVNRPGILSSLGFSLLIVSLVIQLKQTNLVTLILECIPNVYTPGYDFSKCHDVKLVSGPEAEIHREGNEDIIRQIMAANNGSAVG